MNKRWFKNITIFLGVLGPAVITTMAGNDGAGVITYAAAGAQLGYSILFILPILTILYAVTQEMGSRIAIVTGKGLGDLIRERFGIRTAIFVFLALIIANFGTVVTDVAALKTAAEMLHIQSVPFILATIIFCFIIVTATKYEKSQKIFLSGIFFYFVYVFAAVMGKPDWETSLTSMVVPQESIFTKDYFFVAIAVLGTTIAPWGQFFIQSYMKDKNVSVHKLKFAKLEAYVGAFISNLFTYFIIVVTASTLYVNHIVLDSGDKAALAIQPFAGELAGILFAVGLIVAAIIGIVIVSLTSAYAFTEFFGFTGSLDKPYKKGKIFYTNYLLNMVLATILVLTPFFPLFKIVLYTQALNGILLPLFFFYLLKIVNDKELMGKYVNGRLSNVFSVVSTVFIAIAAVAAVVISLFGV